MGKTILLLFALPFFLGWRGQKYAKTKGFLTAGKRGTIRLNAGSYLSGHVGAGIVIAPAMGKTPDDHRMKKACTWMSWILMGVALLIAFGFNDIITVLPSGYTLWVTGGMVPFLFGLIPAAIVCVVVSLCTQRKAPAEANAE